MKGNNIMAVQSTVDEINNFLVEVKALVAAGNYDFIPRLDPKII